MIKRNLVFIATSIDGYIADSNGGIDWLHEVPNPEGSDMGYSDFISEIDALVMGRNTFETVCGFPEWPYQQPVFVLSSRLQEIPENYSEKAFLIKGTIPEVLDKIHQKGYYSLYVDGGKTIQSFLQEDLIDSMVITIIPKLLGGGTPLFSLLPEALDFNCTKSIRYADAVVQNTFVRMR